MAEKRRRRRRYSKLECFLAAVTALFFLLNIIMAIKLISDNNRLAELDSSAVSGLSDSSMN